MLPLLAFFSLFHCWFSQELLHHYQGLKYGKLPRSTSLEGCISSHHSEGSNLWVWGIALELRYTHHQVDIQNRLAHSQTSDPSFRSTLFRGAYLFVAKQNILHEANSCPSVPREVELALEWFGAYMTAEVLCTYHPETWSCFPAFPLVPWPECCWQPYLRL